MKRYWLFAFDSVFSVGGIGDFEGDFDTRAEAILKAREITNNLGKKYARWHIFDTHQRAVIAYYEDGKCFSRNKDKISIDVVMSHEEIEEENSPETR